MGVLISNHFAWPAPIQISPAPLSPASTETDLNANNQSNPYQTLPKDSESSVVLPLRNPHSMLCPRLLFMQMLRIRIMVSHFLETFIAGREHDNGTVNEEVGEGC